MAMIPKLGLCTGGSQENLFLSDEEGSEEDRAPAERGYLMKWTNLLHGWQERYFLLKDAVFTYYRSQDDQALGCRGSLMLKNAIVRPHEYDDCRFEVRVGDTIWYLRGLSAIERSRWIQAMQQHRISSESGYGSSEPSLRRHNSLISLNSITSTSVSLASASSFKRSHGLLEKLAEMETYREILMKQVDSLQGYFDTCSTIVSHAAHNNLEHLLEENISTCSNDERASTVSSGSSDEAYPTLTHHALNPLYHHHHTSLLQAPPLTSFNEEIELNHSDEESSSVVEDVDDDDLRRRGSTVTNNATPSLAPPSSSTGPVPSSNTSTPTSSGNRGFLSRFFPFRSAPPGPAEATEPAITEQRYSVEQYEPSSRYSDLKRILEQHGSHALDFKGEGYTFKATTTGIITELNLCIETMQRREEQWRRRVEREVERRRRAEEAYRSLSSEMRSTKSGAHMLGGPDYEEGPDCAIGEEEFFDAVDAQLDKMAEADERLVTLRSMMPQMRSQTGPMPAQHRLFPEVSQVVSDRLSLCDPSATVLLPEDGWNMIAQDGEMKLYRREMETSEGIVLDPLQALHTVEGVTARELCTYFWDVQYRMDWEITIDEPPSILDICGDDTVLLHQVYRRVWPTSQRDAVFWSHIRRVTEGSCSPGASDMWMVVNMSSEAPESLPPTARIHPNNNMIRLTIDVSLICQTVYSDDHQPGDNDRSKVSSKLLYAASINPGGWAPAGVLRTITKREYPRFIKRFSQYVIDKTKDEPLFV